MPYINVDEAYILDNTGLQVDNSVDYANANANSNLIDNSFFTINQRGFTSGTISSGEYVADRWRAQGTSTAVYSMTANGLRVDASSISSDSATVLQRLSLQSLVGKVVTLSAIVGSTVHSASAIVPEITVDNTTIIKLVASSAANVYLLGYPEGSYDYNYVVQLRSIQGYTPTYRAVKLEIGEYSTLINDVAPNYGEELLKCMRYFQRLNTDTSNYSVFANGYGWDASNIYALAPTPVPLRALPSSAVYSGTFSGKGGGASKAITGVSPISLQTNGITLAFTSSSITSNEAYTITALSGAYIDLSADL